MAKKKPAPKKPAPKKPVAKKPAAKPTKASKPVKKVPKKAGKKVVKSAVSTIDLSQTDTFLAIYEESPELVVLFDYLIDEADGSENVTLGDAIDRLTLMNETFARLTGIPLGTTLQKIEYLDGLPE